VACGLGLPTGSAGLGKCRHVVGCAFMEFNTARRGSAGEHKTHRTGCWLEVRIRAECEAQTVCRKYGLEKPSKKEQAALMPLQHDEHCIINSDELAN